MAWLWLVWPDSATAYSSKKYPPHLGYLHLPTYWWVREVRVCEEVAGERWVYGILKNERLEHEGLVSTGGMFMGACPRETGLARRIGVEFISYLVWFVCFFVCVQDRASHSVRWHRRWAPTFGKCTHTLGEGGRGAPVGGACDIVWMSWRQLL